MNRGLLTTVLTAAYGMRSPLILLVLLIFGPAALAESPEKAPVVEIVIPLSSRTEIYLARSKRKTAAAADRLMGGRNTYARALEQRELMKPRRYVPRTVKARVREVKYRRDMYEKRIQRTRRVH